MNNAALAMPQVLEYFGMQVPEDQDFMDEMRRQQQGVENESARLRNNLLARSAQTVAAPALTRPVRQTEFNERWSQAEWAEWEASQAAWHDESRQQWDWWGDRSSSSGARGSNESWGGSNRKGSGKRARGDEGWPDRRQRSRRN